MSHYQNQDNKQTAALQDLEIKALEAKTALAAELDIPEADIKPCIAYMLVNGVKSDREAAAFVLTQGLAALGLSREKIDTLLTFFNSKLERPLPQNQLSEKAKRLSGPKWKKKHPTCAKIKALGPYCSSNLCKLSEKQPERRSVFRDLFATPWPGVLKTSSCMVLQALHELRIRRSGLAGMAGKKISDQVVIFSYKQVEELSGLTRGAIKDHLEKLERYGLIADLKIGQTYQTSENPDGTSLRIVYPMPDPNPDLFCKRTGGCSEREHSNSYGSNSSLNGGDIEALLKEEFGAEKVSETVIPNLKMNRAPKRKAKKVRENAQTST